MTKPILYIDDYINGNSNHAFRGPFLTERSFVLGHDFDPNFYEIHSQKPTVPYFYYVPIYHWTVQSFFFQRDIPESDIVFSPPPAVQDDIRTGLARVWFDDSREGYPAKFYNWNQLLRTLDLQPHQAVFAHSDASHKTQWDIPSIYVNSWERYVAGLYDPDEMQIIDNLRDSFLDHGSLKYHAVFPNRIARKHRIDLCMWIDQNGYHDKIDYSFGLTDWNNMLPDEYTTREFINWLNKSASRFATREHVAWAALHGRKNLSTEGSIDLNENRIKLDMSLMLAHTHSGLAIVSETHFENAEPTLFFSEKTYKPLLLGQPMLMAGPMGMVEELRDQGYDMFDDIIDHGYDGIRDDVIRITVLKSEIRRMISMPMDELVDVLTKTRYRGLKNRELLLERGCAPMEFKCKYRGTPYAI